MHAAVILITTTKGKAWEVAERVSKVEYVKHVYSVTGPYDVIACFETEKPIIEVIKDIVKRIHEIEGVERTITCIAIH